VSSGDTCQVIVDKYKTFTLKDFYSWNPDIGTSCQWLLLEYYVCIGVKGTPTKPVTTTTTPKPTSTKPSPTQPNISTKCSKWNKVVSGDFCQKIADQYKITLANLYVVASLIT
jgi:LysM repeat protein